MQELNTASLVYLLAVFCVFFLCYSTGKKTYSSYIAPLDKKAFPLKDFLPAGFKLMELTKYSYGTLFDRKLRKNIKEIYDPNFTEFYLRVIWALAASYVLLGFLIGAMLTASMGGDPLGAAVGIGIGGLLAYVNFTDVQNKSAKKHLEISMDLPDLTNKIIILSGAGLTLRATLIKIVRELKSERLLYQELEHSISMLEAGSTAEDAFQYLNIRCNMPDMRRFVSVLLQNMHRGGGDVIQALSDIGREQWENRKASAKRVAEEAGTKILFPMMLMLFAVILLTIAPAVMSMNL